VRALSLLGEATRAYAGRRIPDPSSTTPMASSRSHLTLAAAFASRARRPLLVAGAAAFVAGVARLDVHRACWSQDEIDLVSAAVAMQERGEAWLRPTYHPFQPGAFERLGDGLIAPPLASGLMAIPGVLGLRTPDVWPLLGSLLFFAGIALVARSFGASRLPRLLAVVAVTLCLAPRLMLDMLSLEGEIPLAGLGLLALGVALGRGESRLPARAALSGALLGAAFLCKLWLVGPAALATGFVWIARSRGRRKAVLAALAGGFLATACVHLALVAWLDEAALGRWLREVYFAAFGLGGVAATKWTGVAAHPEWSHGAWYYPAAIVRELGFAAPLAAFGALRLGGVRRRCTVRASEAALTQPLRAALLGFAVGVAILSVPPIKEPLYVLPALAFGVAIAARALYLLSHTRRASPALAAAVVIALVVAFTLRVPTPPADDDRLPYLRQR
jgi:hypothetical protein